MPYGLAVSTGEVESSYRHPYSSAPDNIDLFGVEQIAEVGQLRAIAAAMDMPNSNADGQHTPWRSWMEI